MIDESFFKNLSSKIWQFTYDRRMSYQRMKLFNYGYCHQFSEFFKVNLNSEIYRVKDGNVSVYYELNDHKLAFSRIQEKLLGHGSVLLIKKIIKIIKNFYSDFIKKTANKPLSYSSYSNKELIKVYDDFLKLNQKISLPTWFLYLYFEEVLTNTLESLLKEHIRDTKQVKDIISTLSNPSKINPLDSYNKDLYQVALVSDNDYQKSIDDFFKKYISWGVYDVNYNVLDINFHKDKIKNIDRDKVLSLITEIDKKYKNQLEIVTKLKKDWATNKKISALMDLYSLYADFKDWKNYYREQNAYKLKILFEEIAVRISLTHDQVSFLIEKEIHDALNGDLIINTSELDRRIKDSAFVFMDNELLMITNTDDLKKIDECLIVQDHSLIRGVSAYSGIVRGAVKIVFSVSDFSKVNDGDILVASTTRPDYLALMKKVSGFITNEGGVLSHAAILARELKKPCIIGTKIATKVLKDGDEVEVDADKGIVKIIKRA